MSHIEETGRVLKMLNRLFRNGFKTKKSLIIFVTFYAIRSEFLVSS